MLKTKKSARKTPQSKWPGFEVPKHDRNTVAGRGTPARSLSHAKRWQLQDAKARFSRLVKDAQSDGPQIITLYGQEVAVVQSIMDYNKSRHPKTDHGPNIFEVLLKCPPGPPLVIDRDPNDVVGVPTPSVFD